MKPKKIKPSKNQVQELKNKCEEYLTGWQRAQADYANLQKETAEKIKDLSTYTKAALLTDLIPILDNFSKATAHVPEEQQKENWVIGIFQIKKQLEEFLANNGLEKIESLNQPFDPEVHEAVGKEKTSKDKDLVLKEVSSGYKLNGKVIIPAKVIVSE